ncbi:MAG TPA: hypothetical protein PLH70_03880 [Bacteroidales bacterium]|nr:hypothetical protein [Bacteroidales bacterium]HQB74922.1 hypothetical protein [Bacteroidales bacterium]
MGFFDCACGLNLMNNYIMTEKFRDKYRIPSTRLQNWDYHWAGTYFITICAHNRENYFGEINNGEMKLSEIGIIAEQEWIKTFKMRPDMNLQMGAFVVMPNHFHSIITIGKNKYNNDFGCRDAMPCVSKNENQNKNENQKTKRNHFGPQSKNLASIIRGFKIGVTTRARHIETYFAWQSLFYDILVRDKRTFDIIETYIKKNPSKWIEDRFYND